MIEIIVSTDAFGATIVTAKRSGKKMVLSCSRSAFRRGLLKYHQEGLPMQEAFPFLGDDEREFLISGLTPEEWKDIFSSENK